MVRNPDGKVDSVRRVIGKVGAPSTFLPRIYNYIVEEETGVDVCESGRFIKIDKKMLKSQLQKELRLNNDGIPAEELNGKVEKQYNSILRSSQMYFTAVPKCSFGCCVSMLGQQGGFLTYQTREGHHVNQPKKFLQSPRLEKLAPGYKNMRKFKVTTNEETSSNVTEQKDIPEGSTAKESFNISRQKQPAIKREADTALDKSIEGAQKRQCATSPNSGEMMEAEQDPKDQENPEESKPSIIIKIDLRKLHNKRGTPSPISPTRASSSPQLSQSRESEDSYRQIPLRLQQF